MNIKYKTSKIAQYFAGHRDRWADFYPSERWVIERVATERGLGRVLDVGCATGGLGLALSERKLLSFYAGIDINAPAIEAALAAKGRFSTPCRFECGDILRSSEAETFDTVFNLSCADWNFEAERIIAASWKRVAPGGHLIISLRLTGEKGINDIKRSYQPIVAGTDHDDSPEIANYVVFNVNDALALFNGLSPSPAGLLAYGYWGKPSKTAVTPYKRLVFSVFAVKKGPEEDAVPSAELHLPFSLWKPTARRP